jgi:hypothetical protein
MSVPSLKSPQGPALEKRLEAAIDLAARRGEISDYVQRLMDKARRELYADRINACGLIARVEHAIEVEFAEAQGLRWWRWVEAGRPGCTT